MVSNSPLGNLENVATPAIKYRFGILLAVALLIPVLAWGILPLLPSWKVPLEIYSGGKSYETSELIFEQHTVGAPPVDLPCISNVQILDINGDGNNEILVCNATANEISVCTYQGENEWKETPIIENVGVPAHATAVDIDNDSDLDIVVAVLGSITPSDDVIGRVELHERTEDGYARHVILDDVHRVADVQPGDFDQDGDIDLAVAVFGYSRGHVLWLENKGNNVFQSHELLSASGTIHVPVGDFDGDGDLDIATGVSQDEEELWGFENLGNGQFQPRRLWMTFNFDLGSAGLVKADLDLDGDLDLILPVGDNLEDGDAYPQPYHGCFWFENLGDWKFTPHRISDLGGTYAAAAADIDGDGDLDVTLVSMSNDWNVPGTASVVWLENDGKQNFKSWQVADHPIHLVTVAVGDINQDGKIDIVGGGLNIRKPFQRIGRVSAWLNKGATEK